MSNMSRIRLAIVAISLAFYFNIFIINEEFLVCCTFSLFLLFCSKTMAEAVQDTFQSRSFAIEQELSNSLLQKLEAIKEYRSYNQTILQRKNAIQTILKHIVKTFQTTNSFQTIIQNTQIERTKQRLNLCVASELKLKANLQRSIAQALDK